MGTEQRAAAAAAGTLADRPGSAIASAITPLPQEREGKDAAKTDASRLLADTKRLERQRAELLAAFRKQTRLVDVLRRQKIHLEAARALGFAEEEFMRLLELGGAGA